MSDKETAPCANCGRKAVDHFCVQGLNGEYYQPDAELAAECTAPAPQPDAEKIRLLLIRAVMEMSYMHCAEVLSLVRSSEGESIIEEGMKILGLKDLSEEELARVRAVAPAPQVANILASLKEFLALRQACIDVGGSEGPLDQELITRLAEMQIGVVDRAQGAIAEFERQSSEQASPTQSARECFLEMAAFLKLHPNEYLQAKIDELLTDFPAASVTPIDGRDSWTEEELSNFGKLATQAQPAPTEHLIKAMASKADDQRMRSTRRLGRPPFKETN